MLNVHLCCGPTSHLKGWVNVDQIDFGQEVVHDLSTPWTFLPAGTVDQIYCKDGFEHFDSGEFFLEQAASLLRVGGRLRIEVPHYKNPSAYRMTHKRLMSWNFFSVYPEPHDRLKNLKVVSNRLLIGWKDSTLWHPIHWLINLAPKWWERVGYVSNLEVIFERVAE